MSVLNNVLHSVLKNTGRSVVVQQGSVLNLFANSDTTYANDDRNVTADETSQSIKLWFDWMNEEFDKLYEIYT